MIYEDALRSFQGITPEDCVNPANVAKSDLTYKGRTVWLQPRGKKIYWIDPDLEEIFKITGKEVSLGDRVIHIRGTISGVSIAPALPANEAERRVLEYLAGLNG